MHVDDLYLSLQKGAKQTAPGFAWWAAKWKNEKTGISNLFQIVIAMEKEEVQAYSWSKSKVIQVSSQLNPNTSRNKNFNFHGQSLPDPKLG